MFPAPDQPVSAYNGFFARCNASPFSTYDNTARNVGSVNTEEFIFNDVFIQTNRNLRLPVTSGNYVSTPLQRTGRETILKYRDGSSFLDKYRVGNGILLVCAAPLDESISDLSGNAEIFIPLLYKAAIATNIRKPGSYIIGRNNLIEVEAADPGQDQVYTFKGTTEFIPGMTPMGAQVVLSPGDQVREAGFYQLFSGEKPMGTYAFNYDRAESQLECFSPGQLAELVGPRMSILQASARTSLTDLVSERDKGIQLW